MGKRASLTAAKGKAAKAPKTAAAKPFAAELALLQQAQLPDSCHDMLVAMMPHVWSSPESDRHAYQATMAETFGGIFHGVEAEKQQALATAKAAAVEAQGAAAKAAEVFGAAEAVVAGKQEIADAAAKATQGDTALRLAAATGAVSAAQTKQAGLGDELAKAEADKAAADTLFSAAWEPVKAGTLTGREKEQAIKKLQQASKKLGLQDSFLDALPVAFKLGEEERGDFARALLDFGDAKLQAHLASCTVIISGFEATSAQCATNVTAAEAELTAARAAQGLVEDAMIAAENAMIAVLETRDAAAETKALQDEQVSETESAVTEAETQLAATQALIAKVGKADEEAGEAVAEHAVVAEATGAAETAQHDGA